LNSVYFTNSGAEAIEGSMKLAKRVTGRTQILAFNKSYHGSTQGALSKMGSEYWRNAFRPLLPGITHQEYGSFKALEEISEQTACVVVETVQAEAGIIAPTTSWMHELRKKCSEAGALLVLDEVQAGFGRTGKLWGFEHFGIVPDILVLGKALGGGLPLGAFIADRSLMGAFTDNPVLGHITTFGGHPLSCAAGMAAMNVLLNDGIMEHVSQKEALFKSLLDYGRIKDVRSFGLWLAIEFDSAEINSKVISACIGAGVFTDWFLFAPESLRISPPLTITEPEIEKCCMAILNGI
jgi:acetylornithine/succinyldiaminopimelate/putrescine aminotransferase